MCELKHDGNLPHVVGYAVIAAFGAFGALTKRVAELLQSFLLRELSVFGGRGGGVIGRFKAYYVCIVSGRDSKFRHAFAHTYSCMTRKTCSVWLSTLSCLLATLSSYSIGGFFVS